MADPATARIDQDQSKLSWRRLKFQALRRFGGSGEPLCRARAGGTELALSCASRVRRTSLTQFTAGVVPISTTSSENCRLSNQGTSPDIFRLWETTGYWRLRPKRRAHRQALKGRQLCIQDLSPGLCAARHCSAPYR